MTTKENFRRWLSKDPKLRKFSMAVSIRSVLLPIWNLAENAMTKSIRSFVTQTCGFLVNRMNILDVLGLYSQKLMLICAKDHAMCPLTEYSWIFSFSLRRLPHLLCSGAFNVKTELFWRFLLYELNAVSVFAYFHTVPIISF